MAREIASEELEWVEWWGEGLGTVVEKEYILPTYLFLYWHSYMSGRQAISQSRCDNPGPLIGSRGFYTLVFDDVEDTSLLAYFTPTGKACCYYQSGAIHMLSDNMGGCLYNEVHGYL